ncbi:PREDICTED: transcription elongation factor SPT6-like [Priapulus caudatus]|uniref:Transcription elongation factor SPT6-like n=1 Tax=Priapulus caudatus TaxID=37621 RepID=A0ABM1EQM5_PRICU|nr:PREDICTED: transcription elongation factor SPT6-like [Priapulus caudatus]
MSGFLEDEAEVSGEDDQKSGSESDEDSGAVQVKEVRHKKKSKAVVVDSSEEEEDDEDLLREEMKDLINDDVEEESASSGSDDNADRGRKRKKRGSGEEEDEDDDDDDDRLEDEDYDLIEENLGVKVKRKKFRRLRKISDDDDSDNEAGHDLAKVDDRDAIANELFQGSDDDESTAEPRRPESVPEEVGDDEEGEEESDVDDFIVDDEGEPISKEKTKKKRYRHADAALQEAQDIFGVDFDMTEFDQYGDDGYEEYEEAELDYEDEEVEEGEEATRTKKKPSKKKAKKSIFDVYEPSELERSHFTEVDNTIRTSDVPERFQASSRKLYNWLKIAPYQAEQQLEDYDDEDYDPSHGLRVISIAFVPELDMAAFAAFVDGEGNMQDFLRLCHLNKRKNSYHESDKTLKETDLRSLKRFITSKKPHVVVVGTDCRDAAMIQQDVQELVTDLESDNQMAPISVELVDNELSEVYSTTKRADQSFRDYPPLLRQAISLARRIQDPLIEFSQKVTFDQFSTAEDVIKGSQHMVATQISREPLVRQCVRQTYYERAKIHIAPTKKGKKEIDENHMLYSLKYIKNKPVKDLKGDQFLKMSMLRSIHVKPTEERELEEEADWIYKHAFCTPPISIQDMYDQVEGLSYTNTKGPTAIGKIREALNFMRNQQFEVPFIAFYRKEYVEPDLNINDLWKVYHWDEKWSQLRRRKKNLTRLFERMQHYQYEQVAADAWAHFDAGNCEGAATGVKVRLDNGVTGFIPIRNLSDKRVEKPEERVARGMTIHARITKIDIERFHVEVTSKSSDLLDSEAQYKPPRDLYYDADAEENEIKRDEEVRKRQRMQTYVKRVIVHPSFHNIGYKDAEKLMNDMDQGDVIIRPSSKGSDHLTVMWKVDDNIYQHIDVREEGKENAFSLGQSLLINNEEFEDLDEIIARHIQPMAAFARDVLLFKYYEKADGGKREILENLLRDEKGKATTRIPYLISLSTDFPGKFMLSYLPRVKTRHEYATITPDGFRYRGKVFQTLNSLLKWFKEHFREPIPGVATPMIGGRTPGLDHSTIQRAVSSLPPQMYNTLAAVAGATPLVGGFSVPQQPFATPLPVATPMMTPSYHNRVGRTPNAMVTPQYQPSSQGNWAHPATPRHHPSATPRTPSYSSSQQQQQHQQQHHHNQHHQHHQQRAAAHSSSRPGAAGAAVDWGKAAAQWAQKSRDATRSTPRQSQRPSPRPVTKPSPRASPRPSPAVQRDSSYRSESPPAGDATPLYDEN